MSTRELAAMIGKTVLIHDRRTCSGYYSTIIDSRANFGRLEIRVGNEDVARWFEPTPSELESVREAGK